MDFIDLKSQQSAIRSELDSRISDVLSHGKYILGPEVEELERLLADYVGVEHCITVSSGTDALLISLMAMGIGNGDEVITTPFTFISTIEVIIRLGAKPVLIDIELDTGNINVAYLERVISKKTKAIIPVSLYGQPCDMDEINHVAGKYGLYVIEDGAQSFGATYKGRRSCGLSDVGCTSFFPSKPLGCYGDGGAIFTRSDTYAEICGSIRVHGQRERYVYESIGIGGRMDTLQCAILLAKFTRFEWEVEQRQLLANYYDKCLDSIGVKRVKCKRDRISIYAQYTVFVDERDRVVRELSTAGIPSAVHYPKVVYDQPAYTNYFNGMVSCQNAEILSSSVLSLPMSPYIEKEDIDNVVEALDKALFG